MPLTEDDCSQRCVDVAQRIEDYVDRSENAYRSNSVQMSTAILLLMELWVEMDTCAVRAYPLLKDYSPGFPLHVFNSLHLPLLNDMIRLQRVQAHLDSRLDACAAAKMTIFDDPSHSCFAARWFDLSPDLRKVQQQIEADAEKRRQEKVLEHERVKAEYDQLIQDMAGMDCTTITDESYPDELVHNVRRCEKCSKSKQSRGKRISPLEHPLPRQQYEAKATIFELNIPVGFSAYRDATWKIISTIARETPPRETTPQIFLQDYPKLSHYRESPGGKFCLASRNKIASQTHRNTVHVCQPLEQFFVNCGLELRYFDNGSLKNWVATTRLEPSFMHHCKITIPDNSPLANVLTRPELSTDARRPESNKILSSEPDCPNSLNVHEFLAFQMLFSPSHTRWDFMLMQLGSSTLNFSSEAISNAMQHLTTEAGPVHGDDPTHHLRAAHAVFEDESFCMQLIDQITSRLSILTLNWRDSHSMSMIIALLSRLYSLASPTMAKKALQLIQDVRSVLSRWNSLLGEEIRNATSEASAQICGKYAFLTAILGRRTFSVFAESCDSTEIPNLYLNSETMVSFIAFSVAFQNNCPNPQKLSASFKAVLVQDMKLTYSLRHLLRRSIEQHPQCLANALGALWPDLDRQCSNVHFLDRPNEGWCEMKITNPHMRRQSVMFHILEGHLRIDGQSLGRLSENIRKDVVIQELFGDSNLHVYPSPAQGMQHVLTVAYWGTQIHVGTRNGQTIVRTLKNGVWHELIPRDKFRNSFTSTGDMDDLPSSLIEGCHHFLNLATNTLEVRKPNIWKTKDSNWVIDLNTRTARRNAKSSLVDPQSDLARRIARIFQGFELPRHITVYYPPNGPIYVEIKRLELQFRVNSQGFLESLDNNFQIDADQDAGCLYGLRSFLVVKERNNWSNRALLVPLLEQDALTCRRPQRPMRPHDGIHVNSWIAPRGTYVKYSIDNVLGRMTCAMEPAMLYQLALMHAVTSFVVPDKLTGQTGSEQALNILQSAYAIPCVPLPRNALAVLNTIAKLSPTRGYYPPDAKCQQVSKFSPMLTSTVQRDEFQSLISAIYEVSDSLSVFHAVAPHALSAYNVIQG